MDYDYVIVGGGSAGCVMAGRLSEDPARRVLLLEAGEHEGGLWSRIPLGVGRILNDASRTWTLQTEPAAATDNIARVWHSGKCLGGSSAVNGLLYVRGHPERYDAWGRIAGEAWSHAQCLPVFRRLERFAGPAGASRGRDGPLSVSMAGADPLSDRFLRACESLGYARIDDYNDTPGIGASYLQLSARRGLRCDAARAWLREARRRPNLTILSGAVAQRVLLDGGRARAVVARVGGVEREFAATREVVLTAGAVRTPQLLQVSGIGPAEVLERAGVPLRLRNDAVGAHLQDHVMVRLCFRTREPGTINAMLASTPRLVAEALRFALTRGGLLSTASLKSTLYAASEPSRSTPDLRIQLALISATDRIPKSLRAGFDAGSAFQIGVYGLYPQSSGHVRISAPSFDVPPVVQPNYLADPHDRAVLLSGLRIARRIAGAPPLREVIEEEIRPGAAVTSDDELLGYARKTGQTCWHPVSTCRMGPPDSAVVDAAGRVHGLSGLRIADASVFPLMTSSNTNAPTLMLAEKIAQTMR